MKKMNNNKMFSIKTDSKDIKNIISNLNILIAKYIKKNGDINNAIILVPVKTYNILEHFKKEIEILALSNEIRIIENKYLEDELIIIDKTFFDSDYFKKEIEWQNQ